MALKETARLLKVVHELRTRCPWDRKQTHKTLVPYFIEETYEAVEAIENNRPQDLCEELGDVLLQVALHSEIAKEKGKFTFEKVAGDIADKMIRRHPHIYKNGIKRAKNYKAHMKNWQKLKNSEKPKRKSALEGIPKMLPALQLSQRYGEIASHVGLDWKNHSDVLKKVREELGELEAEVRKKRKKTSDLEMEMGDLLFSLTQLSRHLKINAESALRKSTQKFSTRFERMEKMEKEIGKKLHECSEEELEILWNKIKKK